MPNRILHERICVSDTLAQLSGDEERLFYRLIVQCDDYGRFDGRVSVIRARCFPLQLGRVSDADVADWLARCVEVGLVAIYAVDGHAFVQITTWTRYQYPRAKHSKFPDPGNGVQASASTCLQIPTDSLVTGNVNEERGTVNEERLTRIEERKRSTPPLPPSPQAARGERKSRRRRGSEQGEDAAPATSPPEVLAPLAPEDAALWALALGKLPPMTEHNRAQVARLEPLGRGEDGGLRLRAPPGLFKAERFQAYIGRALADAGDAEAAAAAIVER